MGIALLFTIFSTLGRIAVRSGIIASGPRQQSHFGSESHWTHDHTLPSHSYFSLTRHEPRRKRSAQQFCCLLHTDPLPSNLAGSL
jgi:hypothetical protein